MKKIAAILLPGMVLLSSCSFFRADQQQAHASHITQTDHQGRDIAQARTAPDMCPDVSVRFEELLRNYDACNSRGGQSCQTFCSGAGVLSSSPGRRGEDCGIPTGYVSESSVVAKINEDLNLTIRSSVPLKGFGRGERECVQNVLSAPEAIRLVDSCNARATYIKRCSLAALPGSTFGPLTSVTQRFEGSAHKRNCGNSGDNINCGRPLCESDLNQNIARYQNSCVSQFGVPCDVASVGETIHSYNDGKFRCTKTVSITPNMPGGVSCQVMIEARNGVQIRN